MSDDDLFRRVTDFIIQERGRYRFELLKDHSLQEDLKIYGIDAVEFIVNFGKQFNVDVSQFEANKYFKPDGYGCTKNNFKKLLVSDLMKSVMDGVLL